MTHYRKYISRFNLVKDNTSLATDKHKNRSVDASKVRIGHLLDRQSRNLEKPISATKLQCIHQPPPALKVKLEQPMLLDRLTSSPPGGQLVAILRKVASRRDRGISQARPKFRH